MMVREIVVDTNIFEHSNNEGIWYCATARKFLEVLAESDIEFCMDEGCDVDTSKNKSQIFNEYFERLRNGSFGYGILLKILRRNFNKPIARSQYVKHKKKFEKIVRDKIDRIFLSVAFVSCSKVLMSNDFIDFQRDKRKYIKKKFNLNILSSDQSPI
jgi:predicted nucleic acid-binding protein